MKKILSLLLAVLFFMPATQAKIKVHTIGDSTMAEYDENTTDKRGWGMYLGSFFNSNFVEVNNRGKSGADTRRFYNTANLWPSVKAQMSEGDYLIIQFAHNDEGTVTNGMDNLEYAAYCKDNGLTAPTDDRGTNPQTTYREFLCKFIDEARAMGVTPILAGPICRAYINGNSIKRSGLHDLGDKFSKIENGVLYENQSLPANDSTMSYVKAMKVVAAEKNVPFIDMTAATRDLYLSYGNTCLDQLFVMKDNGVDHDATHTNAMGGNLVARLAAQLLKSEGILADYIEVPTEVTANPTSIEIGDVYCNVEQNKEFLLTGYGLTPTEGTVTLSATSNLQLSLDKATYSATANVSYSGGSMFQKVYIRALYTTGGTQNDTVYAVCGEKTITIPVTANALSLEGGAAVSATWTINAKPMPDPAIEGPISAAYSLSNMAFIDYNTGKNYFVDGEETGLILARFHNSDATCTARVPWPAGQEDEDASRYIDFAVTAPSSMDVRITNMNFAICGDGTSTMCCHINTGMGDDFMDVTTIYERTNLPNRTVEHVELTPTVTVPAGETLHVRILPWHDHAEVKDSKYICLRSVAIKGMAFEPGTAIDQVSRETTKAQKVVRDGQIYIVRPDGKEYTILGAQMK